MGQEQSRKLGKFIKSNNIRNRDSKGVRKREDSQKSNSSTYFWFSLVFFLTSSWSLNFES